MSAPIRVIAGKIGLDGHDRGIKVVAQALRDAGMEVVYLGMRLGADQLARAVADEDADVLAVNFSGADHLDLVPKLMAALEKQGMKASEDDLLVVAGGIIPDADIAALKAHGIREVFLPGTPLADIVAFIGANVPKRAHR